MFRSLKRVLSGILFLIIILSFSLVPIEAKLITDMNKIDDIIKIRFAYIDMFKNSFDIAESGKSSFSTVLWSRNVDEVHLTCYLQQYNNGTWDTIKSYSNETNGTEGILSSSWYVVSGYSYRYKSYAYLYKDGSFVESTSFTSSSIYY